MTTMTEPVVTSGTLNRILAVFKLQFVNPATVIVTPLLILVAIFLMNVTIWWLIMANLDSTADRADVADGFQWSGAATFIFVYMMVVAVQAISSTFSFALGLSVTRRDYYLGTALSFVGFAAIFSTILAAFAAVEEATGGWGLGGRMFTAIYFGDGAWYERYFIFFALLLFFFFVGAVAAAIFVRWRAIGLTAFLVGLGFLLVGLMAIFTFTATWEEFGSFFVTNGWTGSYAWSLVPTAIAAIAGYFVLRRATPRS
jgi:hypothetical protein